MLPGSQRESMKKFSKPASSSRAASGERPARKSYAAAGAAPRRPYGARDDAAPRRPYTPRDDAAPRPARSPRAAPSRPYAPRGDASAERPARSPRSAPARPYAPRGEGAAERPARSAYGDPYERAQRPRRDDAAGESRTPARGFTVTLDPDVARVFRGDASVNKALRLVLQMMQVVEGPAPRSDRPAPRARAGYQGSDEARGFTRKPRFVEEDADE
jgi:ATP-dependent RNA helicase DeaD